MTSQEIIALAESHIPHAIQPSSAVVCLSDAKQLQSNGEEFRASVRAMTSLAYSIGILHPDYRKVVNMLDS